MDKEWIRTIVAYSERFTVFVFAVNVYPRHIRSSLGFVHFPTCPFYFLLDAFEFQIKSLLQIICCTHLHCRMMNRTSVSTWPHHNFNNLLCVAFTSHKLLLGGVLPLHYSALLNSSYFWGNRGIEPLVKT